MTDDSRLPGDQNDVSKGSKGRIEKSNSTEEDSESKKQIENSLEESNSLRETIEEQIENIEPGLSIDLPQEKKEKLINFAMKVTRHRGPLPSPETLRQYNEVIPDLGERLVTMAEKEGDHRREIQRKDADHRREMDKKLVEGSLSFPKRGQMIAAGLTVFIVSLGSYLVATGNATAGTTIIVSTVVSLAAIFVLGKFLDNKTESVTNEEDDE
ncbi:hypothetical protein Dfri01_38980 [Dyadobacter frigoris]|uniref:DUF2335 domain-containing protein n=1 Tax=Dyadobacter frigoris TaxID=2576211 RepID=UPI0024A444BF|nr:DUF2335 domain-containing protein [Dyadobacter frigoris]GLU54437.1 hypothetical protein Dfri01_38980 [Dyadobacter frigoris]